MKCVIVNEIDGRFKVVEEENPKGTAFGDSDCLMEALEGALMLCGEDELISVNYRCDKCKGCTWNSE